MSKRLDRYETKIYPLIEKLNLDAEAMHHLVIFLMGAAQKIPGGLALMQQALVEQGKIPQSERLRTTIGGLEIANPIILAAGYDKNAEAVGALCTLGFGSIVVGTTLERPQPGNDQPRLFRPQKGAVLNRYGFNSEGGRVLAQNLQKARRNSLPPIGISIGLNKDTPRENAPQAHARVLEQVCEYADYIEINVSSPNTEGLRSLLTYTHMKAIIQTCRETLKLRGMQKPLFIKISPDMTIDEIDGLLPLIEEEGIAGFVMTNTSVDPEIKKRLGKKWETEQGGVSGGPLRRKSTELIRHVHHVAPHVPIIGVGGVDSLEGALEKFLAGASALQMLTGLVFRGPTLPSFLMWELDAWLESHGVSNISQIVGQERKGTR